MNLKWQQFSMAFKQAWQELFNDADMPPAVIGYYNGHADVIIVAPRCDRDQGLKAVQMLKSGTHVDAITFISDCHMRTIPKESDDCDNWERGQLQKEHDELGEESGVSPAITCIHINPDMKMECECFPYHFHPKKGIPFKWNEEMKTALGGAAGVTGFIPDALKDIMLQPTMMEDPKHKAVMDKFNFSKDKQHFHMKNALRQFLGGHGYLFLDSEALKEPDVETMKKYIDSAQPTKRYVYKHD